MPHGVHDEPAGPIGSAGLGRPDWVALAGAAATVAAHLILQAAGPNPFFIGGACLFWTAFIIVRARHDRGCFRRWGFRADNLLAASVVPALLLILVAAGFAVYAHWHGTLRFPPHALLLLLIYPLWGLVQQFLALGVVVSNLERLPVLGGRKALLVLAGAALFGLIHAPDRLVMAGTFLLELLLVPLYLRHRNLWPLGVLHGWLGALFYLWALGRDLWVENFG
jgi:hypothetical protein